MLNQHARSASDLAKGLGRMLSFQQDTNCGLRKLEYLMQAEQTCNIVTSATVLRHSMADTIQQDSERNSNTRNSSSCSMTVQYARQAAGVNNQERTGRVQTRLSKSEADRSVFWVNHQGTTAQRHAKLWCRGTKRTHAGEVQLSKLPVVVPALTFTQRHWK